MTFSTSCANFKFLPRFTQTLRTPSMMHYLIHQSVFGQNAEWRSALCRRSPSLVRLAIITNVSRTTASPRITKFYISYIHTNLLYNHTGYVPSYCTSEVLTLMALRVVSQERFKRARITKFNTYWRPYKHAGYDANSCYWSAAKCN